MAAFAQGESGMKPRYLAMPLLCLCLLGTAACDLKKLAANAPQAEQGLMQEMSGVWRTEGNELITINMAGGRLQMLVDDTFVPVQVGATDEENETANIKVRMADGGDVIWTLRKIKDADGKAFHLSLVTHEGKATELGFVRTISADDLARIASLEKPQAPQASVLASIVGETPQANDATEQAMQSAEAAQAAADTAAQAADAAAAQADATAANVAADATAETSTAPVSLTDADGITYSARRNDDGLVLESDNATLYVGSSCDAYSPQYGKASWKWVEGSLTIDFGNRRIVLRTPEPKFARSTCLG